MIFRVHSHQLYLCKRWCVISESHFVWGIVNDSDSDLRSGLSPHLNSNLCPFQVGHIQEADCKAKCMMGKTNQNTIYTIGGAGQEKCSRSHMEELGRSSDRNTINSTPLRSDAAPGFTLKETSCSALTNKWTSFLLHWLLAAAPPVARRGTLFKWSDYLCRAAWTKGK